MQEQAENLLVMALFTLPTRVLTKSIAVASLTKVSVQLLLPPATLKVSLWLKRIENAWLLRLSNESQSVEILDSPCSRQQ